GHLWQRLPWHWTALATLMLGVITAWGAARLSPLASMFLVLALIAGYLTINGLLLFDLGNRIAGVAAPMVAIGPVWSSCMLISFISERGERQRITKRLGAYTDLKIDKFLVKHPENVKFDGEVRELTVVFTDLVGFTSISERLQEKTVPLLNEYFELMV